MNLSELLYPYIIFCAIRDPESEFDEERDAIVFSQPETD